MLFEIRSGLEHSKVFDGLNRFLREVMLAALEGRPVDQNALPNDLYAALVVNKPTQDATTELHAALAKLNQEKKDALRSAVLLNVDPCDFLTNQALPLPVIPDSVFTHLKTLSTHLYQQTGKLVGVESACGECIDDHYARFRSTISPGNGNICCVCGTEYLAQLQAGVGDNEQWRGPYDHLLAKDHYPLYGVHPKNLVPICQTCNAKAKLAKNLLIKNGKRRLSFSPWTENAQADEIQVSIDETDGEFPRVVIGFSSPDPVRKEKLTTWDDVYKIKGRVEGEFLSLCEKIAEDVSAPDDADFLVRLNYSALKRAKACRLTPFNYWRARVYCAVRAMNPESREALRHAISTTDQENKKMEELFFN